jgi:hypothetical protein
MPAEKTAAIEDLASHARGLKSFAAGLRVRERQRRRDGLFALTVISLSPSIDHKPHTVSKRPIRARSGQVASFCCGIVIDQHHESHT